MQSPARGAALVASQRFWPETRSNALLRLVALSLLGSAILAASAHVRVPFWPVPMTMQTGALLLIGASFGLRPAVGAMLAYLLEGIVGLPVFTGGAGLAYLAGPTGGYLVGRLAAAALLGAGAERGWTRRLPGLLALLIAADALVLACGVAWLATLHGLGFAITFGLLPFLAGEAVKIAIAACLLRLIPPGTA